MADILQSVSTTENSITWRIYNFGALPQAQRIFAFYLDGKRVASNIRREPGTTDVTYTFTGLSSDTSYSLKAVMTTTASPNEYTYTKTARTKARVIYETLTSTKTSLTWRLYNFGPLEYTSRTFNFYIRGPEDSSHRLDGSVVRAPGTTDVTYTFTGLTPGTYYDLYATMTATSSNEYDYEYIMAKTDPEVHTLTVSASADYESIFLYAYGLNQSTLARYLTFYVDGIQYREIMIPAGSSSSQSAYYYDVNEGQNYRIDGKLTDTSGNELVSDYSYVTVPKDTNINISASNITDSSITVNAYGLNGNKNYARTLKWYKRGPKDSDYVLASTTSIPANYVNTTFTLPLSNLRANSTYSFKVEMLKGSEQLKALTTSANTLQVPGTLKVDNIAESSVTLLLSGMTSAIGRKIKWYYKKSTDMTYVYAGESEMTSSASSISKVVSGLINETVYNFKAEIYDTTDTDYVIGLKTAIATTQRQVAVMSLGSVTSVSLRVNLSDMETNVNYDKYIYWYIKRSTDANYTEAGLDIVTADSGTSSISHIFTGLVSSTLNPDGTLNQANYDVRAMIKKNDTTTMTTITRTYATTLRDSDIPQPTITEVLQVIGEKKAELWWEAPEHVASSEVYVHYDIETSTDGTSYSKYKTVDVPPQDYTEVVFSSFDMKFHLRIKAYPVGSSADYKLSNVVTLTLTEDFDWETVSRGAECIVRADKWNLLIRYIRKRLSDKRITATYEMGRAKPGSKITAYLFNQLLTACNAFYDTGITAKQPGDAISAADLLKLQEAVNYKEV